MSQGQWKRLDVLNKVEAGDISQQEAAAALGLSTRQVRRLQHRIEQEGEAGLVHRNAGRTPPNRVEDAVREELLKLRRTTYAGFNDHHFTQELRERHQIQLSRATVRRLLRTAGIEPPNKRRGRKVRRRRERKAQFGMMLLWDGSPHDWLEGRGPKMCLMGAIDDATGMLMPGAHFLPHENAVGYLRVLYGLCKRYGVPLCIYMDRHSSLKRHDSFWNTEETLAGKQGPTQVLRALEELGIEPIYAGSAQAKGRVERLWRTLQDRLCSELRLANVCTLEEANRVLEGYISKFNRSFARPAREADCAWRQLPTTLELEDVCGFRIETRVNADHTVQTNGVRIDLERVTESLAGKRAVIRQRLNGELRVYVDDVLRARVEGAAPRHAPKRLRPNVKPKVPRPVSHNAPRQKTKLTFKQIAKKYKTPERTESLNR